MEKTFAIFKPDCLAKNNVQNVIETILDNDLVITKLKKVTANSDLIKKHYEHIIDKPFYPKIEEYMTRGPVLIAILEGKNAIQKWRDLMGHTNPKLADKNSIRFKYGEVYGDTILNVVHGSDSKENAEKEIKLWFGE